MRVVAISCVRNEADIIEPFVRHTLAYCGTLIVVDHGSTDQTVEILDQLQNEGLALRVIRDPTLGHIQVDQMNHLLELAAGEFSADWIFPLDADEFISGATDMSFLPFPVDDLTPCLKIRMRSYYAKPDDATNLLNPVERITRRLIQEPPEDCCKVIVPRPLALHPASRLAQGSHWLYHGSREAPSEIVENVYLAHFSLRSPGQYAIKLAAKHLQSLRQTAARSIASSHYKNNYAQIRESYSTYARTFGLQCISYLSPHDVSAVVSDPLRYLGGPLHYTSWSDDFDNFTRQLLELAERLAHSGQQNAETSGRPQTLKHPTLSIEAFAHPERGLPEVNHVQGGPAIIHSLAFSLNCAPDTVDLHLRVACDPGMVEIHLLTLIYEGSAPRERTYKFHDLKNMLRVLSNGTAVHSENVYRLFISPEPALLTFRHWRQGEEMLPKALRIEVRYENQLLQGTFLSSKVLNSITRETAENEILRGQLELSERFRLDVHNRIKYIIGSVIDFSDQGNAIFFTGKDWGDGEPFGTWTVGHLATLKIHFESAPRQDLWLTAVVSAFVPPSQPEMRANVRVNGEMLATWTLNNWDFDQLHVKIPSAILGRKACEIVFEIINPVSPKEAGVSEDDRLLGLCFKSIELQRAAKRNWLKSFLSKGQ